MSPTKIYTSRDRVDTGTKCYRLPDVPEWNIISGLALYRLCYRQLRKQRIKAYRIRFINDGAPHRGNPTGISGHDPAKFQRW